MAHCGISRNTPRISETEATTTEFSVAVQDVSCFHSPGLNRVKYAPSLLSNLIGAGAFMHDFPDLPELDHLIYPKSVILDAHNRAADSVSIV